MGLAKPTDIDAIVERMAVGRHSPADLVLLHDQLRRLPNSGSFQIGDDRVATDHGQYFQVGDRHYYGLDAVRIRSVLAGDNGRDVGREARGSIIRRVGTALSIIGGVALATGLALLALVSAPIWAAGLSGDFGRVSELAASDDGTWTLGLMVVTVGAVLMKAGSRRV